MDKPALSDTENEALRETEIRLLAEASRERPRVIRRMHLLPRPSVESLGRGGDGVPCRGLPWGASHEAELASGCRDPLLEARGEEGEDPVGSVVAGEGPTTYLLAFIIFLDGTLATHLMFCLGYPILRYPTSIMILIRHHKCS